MMWSTISDKKFYPVIHCVDPYESQGNGHALKNTKIAIDCGADGVFLIGHSLNFSELCGIYEVVRKNFPGIWIGVNFLDISPVRNKPTLRLAVKNCIKLNALWLDSIPDERLDIPSSIQIFGGVAFKYQAPNLSGEALFEACTEAIKFVDVATTSGDRTGSPPSVEKIIQIISNVADAIPIAIASGVDSDNISDFLPFVDMFLVASSITERKPEHNNQEYFVPEKVKYLANKIHSWKL